MTYRLINSFTLQNLCVKDIYCTRLFFNYNKQEIYVCLTLTNKIFLFQIHFVKTNLNSITVNLYL